MTEYDYSPDAVEKYMEKQRKISRWADEQARLAEANRYSNPFLPSDARSGMQRSESSPVDSAYEGSRHSRSQSTPRTHHSRTHYSSHGHGHTSTPTLVQHEDPYSHSRSHSHSRSRSHSRPSSRSHTRPPPSRSHSYAANHHQTTSQGHLVYDSRYPHHTYYDPDRSSPMRYASSPAEPFVMQQGKKTLVVVPTEGSRVKIMVCYSFSLWSNDVLTTRLSLQSPHSMHSTSPYTYSAGYSSHHSPEKKQPLLKRLFNVGSQSGSRRSQTVVMPNGSRSRRRTSSLGY